MSVKKWGELTFAFGKDGSTEEVWMKRCPGPCRVTFGQKKSILVDEMVVRHCTEEGCPLKATLQEVSE